MGLATGYFDFVAYKFFADQSMLFTYRAGVVAISGIALFVIVTAFSVTAPAIVPALIP